jgi:hypothetical protein
MEASSLAGVVLDLVLLEGVGVGGLDFRSFCWEVLGLLRLLMRMVGIERKEGL